MQERYTIFDQACFRGCIKAKLSPGPSWIGVLLRRLPVQIQCGLMCCFERLFHDVLGCAAFAGVYDRQLCCKVLQHGTASCLCGKLTKHAMPCMIAEATNRRQTYMEVSNRVRCCSCCFESTSAYSPSSTAATHPLVPSASPASPGSRCTSCMHRHEPRKCQTCMRSGQHAIHAGSLCLHTCHQQRKGTHCVVLLQIAIAGAGNSTLPDVCHIMRFQPLSPQAC